MVFEEKMVTSWFVTNHLRTNGTRCQDYNPVEIDFLLLQLFAKVSCMSLVEVLQSLQLNGMTQL